MPTRIYLVRHGATDLTAEDCFAGSSEVPLSEEGRCQVAGLAAESEDGSRHQARGLERAKQQE
jgi:broad specificity phosphatase PhoE